MAVSLHRCQDINKTGRQVGDLDVMVLHIASQRRWQLSGIGDAGRAWTRRAGLSGIRTRTRAEAVRICVAHHAADPAPLRPVLVGLLADDGDGYRTAAGDARVRPAVDGGWGIDMTGWRGPPQSARTLRLAAGKIDRMRTSPFAARPA